MDTMINLIVKVQQFEDKRILAKASWNIRELKGKLSEIYPTSTEEQKLIYSGKLLNDTVVLKDVLREYEGQEAHTVHLVFTPKTSSRLLTKLKENSTSQSQSSEMSTSELRQRHTTTNAATVQEQQQQATTNIPSNYYNAFYGNMPFDANSVLAQQYAMQTWMQQAYAQYMNQYMNIIQQQQTQQAPNLAGFMQPQMPFISPTIVPTPTQPSSTIQSPNNPEIASSAAPQQQPQAQVEQPPQQAAAEPQRRFPNIIQDEQENRDWLDIVYSMSRLLILLCLVYFYSSPLRCLIVILIGISIYLYHIYRQNQSRLNNNNTTRVNLNNVNRPAPAAAAPRPENGENPEQATEENQQAENSETEPLVNASDELQSTEPQVSWLTIARTFVVSFVASIIPEHPAM